MTGGRKTPAGAHGEPPLWLLSGALAVCLAMIVLTLGLIVYEGGRTFWPRPLVELTLDDGTTLLGQREITEPGRTRYRVANRDLGQASSRWIEDASVAASAEPDAAVVVERVSWGPFFGVPERVEVHGEDGTIEVLGEGGGLDAALAEQMPLAAERRGAIERLNERRIPAVQTRITSLEWKIRDVERRAEMGSPAFASGWLAMDVGGAGLVLAIGGLIVWARGRGRRSRVLGVGVLALSVPLLLFGWLEGPLAERGLSPERAADRIAELEAQRGVLVERRDAALAELDELRARDERVRFVVRDPASGRVAPLNQSETEEPMRLSQVLRVTRPNDLGLGDGLGVYAARWGDFLSLGPGEQPGEGGVFPVIVGTVTLTLLLTVGVVPLGVIAALYLREYAKQGVIVSALRIAINNLAGVPSIVYGMFGLGFFCYAVGGFVDSGPSESAPMGTWWTAAGALGVVAAIAGALVAGSGAGAAGRFGRKAAAVLWLVAIGLAVWMVVSSPYFSGFFAAKLPEQPTFGGRGVLWASLTLALLTLPVVIVSTEEALAAVPGSMREGSYGCGASRWQTMKRVVLPASTPGIMTGAILAMARGAGEVAPLMLVGAVNVAPALPVSGDAPFLHGDRTFMHLGFHIYNLGFQSPDAEAARPLVWTTTLLLVLIVLTLNIVAVMVRARLRAKLKTSAV